MVNLHSITLYIYIYIYLRFMSSKKEYSKFLGWNLLAFRWKINLSKQSNRLPSNNIIS